MRAGLAKIQSDTPVRAGYLEAMGGVSAVRGPFARAEVGLRPAPGLAAFAFGEWNRVEPMAGVGLRWEFDL